MQRRFPNPKHVLMLGSLNSGSGTKRGSLHQGAQRSRCVTISQTKPHKSKLLPSSISAWPISERKVFLEIECARVASLQHRTYFAEDRGDFNHVKSKSYHAHVTFCNESVVAISSMPQQPHSSPPPGQACSPHDAVQSYRECATTNAPQRWSAVKSNFANAKS